MINIIKSATRMAEVHRLTQYLRIAYPGANNIFSSFFLARREGIVGSKASKEQQ